METYFRHSKPVGNSSRKRVDHVAPPVPVSRYLPIVDEEEQTLLLGSGTFGTVLKGQDLESGACVAIKRCVYASSVRHEAGLPANALREINVLRETNHPNIIKLLDVQWLENTSVDLVFELMDSDLSQLMKSRIMSEGDARFLAKQLLSGLSYLHERGIIHRDLKPSNLLLTRPSWPRGALGNVKLKVADFGLSRFVDDPVQGLSTDMVTLWYRAPDVILGNTQYGTCIDMWSFGCIVFEMLRNRPLFKANDESDQLQAIFRITGVPSVHAFPEMAKYVHWPSTMLSLPMDMGVEKRLDQLVVCSRNALHVMQAVLVVNPRARATATQALSMQWFKSEQ